MAAFADVVFEDIGPLLPALEETFNFFAGISKLCLGIPKGVLVPSGRKDSIPHFSTLLNKYSPTWSEFQVRQWAEYLGFVVGPASVHRQWDNVVRKASDTILRWKKVNAGFFFNLLAANIYVLSLFCYIGQLARTDAKVDSCCQFMRSCFFVGPGNWLPASFLTFLCCSLTSYRLRSKV